jgi:hypothetical protein
MRNANSLSATLDSAASFAASALQSESTFLLWSRFRLFAHASRTHTWRGGATRTHVVHFVKARRQAVNR